MAKLKINAIMVVLNETQFIATAIKAIYPHVQRIFVQTGYNRSFNNSRVEPDDTLQKLLDYPDPDGKLTILIRRIPDEALARNSLMRMDGYQIDHLHRTTVETHADIERYCADSDYFWILDGDEIYDPATIEPMLDYLERKRPLVLRVRGITYFHSWNYFIHPSDEFYQPGFIKRGIMFRENRHVEIPQLVRLLYNRFTRRVYGPLAPRVADAVGVLQLPEQTAVFHHAAYVGDDARILKKIRISGHYDRRMEDWFTNVWLKWTPEMKNLHPRWPEEFPGTKHVGTASLPEIIREATWPAGYIES